MLHLLALALTATTLTTPFVPRASLFTPALSELEIGHLLEAPDRRVRVLSPRLQKMVSDGLRRSPTFAGIMRALEDTNVIVQMVDLRDLPSSTDARLVLVTDAGDFRFVRIQVGFNRHGAELTALLGHELFHALEVGRAPEVSDERALARLYRRIGFRVGHHDQFETDDALTIERRIRRELGTPAVAAVEARSRGSRKLSATGLSGSELLPPGHHVARGTWP